MDTILISIVLGNLIDNAIEACEKISKVKPYIKMDVQYLNESLFIRIQNPFTHTIKKDLKGEYLSTKSDDKNHHGIGLKNVSNIIIENNGLLGINHDNNLFSVEIVMFNIKRQEN